MEEAYEVFISERMEIANFLSRKVDISRQGDITRGVGAS